MQIILVQAEVEDIIKAHINTQVQLPVGTELQIDLKASRGDDGFKATIDIIPPGNTSSTPAFEADTAKSKPVIKVGIKEVAKEVVKTEDKPEEKVDTSTPKEYSTEGGVIVQNGTASTATDDNDDVSDPVMEKPQSLFAKLKKPVNA